MKTNENEIAVSTVAVTNVGRKQDGVTFVYMTLALRKKVDKPQKKCLGKHIFLFKLNTFSLTADLCLIERKCSFSFCCHLSREITSIFVFGRSY